MLEYQGGRSNSILASGTKLCRISTFFGSLLAYYPVALALQLHFSLLQSSNYFSLFYLHLSQELPIKCLNFLQDKRD